MSRKQGPLELMLTICIVSQAAALGAQPVCGEFQVNEFTTGTQRFPGVGRSADGDFVVVWISEGQDGDGYGVFARLFDSSGMPSGGEIAISETTASNQRFGSVAVQENGSFIVTWGSEGQDGSGYGVWARRFDALGTPATGELAVNSFTTGAQITPTVAVAPTGDFVVVWASEAQDGEGYGVFGQRLDETGSLLGGELSVNTYTTSHQLAPSIAAADDGSFVAVWQSQGVDGSGAAIVARSYGSDGMPLGNEFQVNTYTTGYQFFPDVAMSPSGEFVIVWASLGQDDDGFGIFGQRFGADAARRGDEFRINTTTIGDQSFPGVSMAASGEFLVVWESAGQDGDGDGIFGQWHGAEGEPLDFERQLNVHTAGDQSFPEVSVADDAGSYLVVWESAAQDGDGLGIFGRKVELIFRGGFETGGTDQWTLIEPVPPP